MRTLFAVGDEKQSIYSFQGADAAQVRRDGQRASRRMATSAGQAWQRIPLDLSFRTVAPVLDAVDRVFADHGRTPGLTAEAAIVRHGVHRLGHGGLVEIWPTEVADDDADVDPWTPLDEAAARAPAERLAERIADDHPRLARQRRDAGLRGPAHHAPATSSSWCASAARSPARWSPH